jgi:tetratricopeptide (TPR) repeat protein
VADPWSEEDRKFLELGLRLFPDNAMIRLGLAQLMRRAGNFPEARGHLERALSARGGLSIDAHHFAHRLEIAWENEDISRRIDELADGGKFAEAIAFIDQKLTEGVDSTVRLRLKPVRENLQVACLTQQIKGALDAHNWDEARRALNELLTSDARPQIKAEARRTLSDLDRQKLGIE